MPKSESPVILIVDDNLATLQLIQNILKAHAYHSTAVQSSREALEFIQHTIPELLLIDINLDGMNGFQLCQKVKAMPQARDIPVIFITGDSSRRNIRKSFEVGGIDYIRKPFLVEEVLSRTSMALNNARAKKVLQEVNKELEERVALQTRELNLLFSITKLASQTVSLQDILRKVVAVIMKNFAQDVIVPEIHYRNEIVTEGSPKKQKELLSSPLSIQNQKFGIIKIFSTNRTADKQSVLTPESKDLLEAVANEVSKIIAQKEAQENVKNQEKYFRALRDSSPEGIVTLDQSRQVVDTNPAFQNIFGFSLKEIKAKQLDNFILPQRLKKEGAEITSQITRRQNILKKTVRKTKKNQEIHCSIIGVPLNIDNQHRDYLLIYRDITREKELEVQLMQANKMEAIGQLAAGIAHEINTPTQYVTSNIEFFQDVFPDLFKLIDNYTQLRKKIDPQTINAQFLQNLDEKIAATPVEFLREEIAAALTDSLEGLSKISKIVDAMRTFSHPSTDEKQDIDLNTIIQKTITVTRNEWKYDAALETDLEESLPPVMAFSDQISQVMLNLIVNAVHAIQAAKPKDKADKGWIKVVTQAGDSAVKIQVTDNGSGIPAEIQDKIFNPFFTTKEVGKGTGQGLSLIYNVVVENHQGKIYFDTEVGQGTTFTVELPIK